MEKGKLQQESAKESQERYRAYLRNSQEGIWRLEFDKPIPTSLPIKQQILLIQQSAYYAEVNQAMSDMFGYASPAAMVGLRLTSVITARPDSPQLTLFIRNSYRLYGLETEEKDRSGNVRYFSHSVTGIIEDGLLVRMWGTQQNVTEIRLAQLAQSRNDTRLKLAIKATNLGIWEWDMKTGALQWSDELKRMYGLPLKEKMSEKKYLKLVHPDDRARVDKAVRSALSSNKKFQIENRIIWPDGSTHWMLSIGKAFMKNGSIDYIMGSCLLVDDRKKFESQLLEYESRFQNMADNAPVMLWMSDTTAKCHYFNRPWLEFTGRTIKQEQANGCWSAGIHPDDYKKSISIYQQAVKSRSSFSMEFRLRYHDGEYRWVSNSGSPLFAPGGEFIGYIGGCTDIEEVKSATRRNQELEVEKSGLLELNHAKDEFISLASHQLRTPATIVKQYIGMLRDGFAGAINEDQLMLLKTAYDSNERQLNFISNLLKVASIDSGKVTLSVKKYNILDLIHEVATSQRLMLKTRKQQINIVCTDNEIMICIDKILIRMVIENLIDNASKFSPENTPIEIRIKTELKNVSITIKDRGIGIDKKDQEKLFQKFSRIQNHLTSGIEGTGLGLYWSKKIISMHGGEISLKSAPGNGTKFTVRLPLKHKNIALASPLGNTVSAKR